MDKHGFNKTFVESLMIFGIDHKNKFAFVYVGILYSLVMKTTTMFQMVLFLVILTFFVMAHMQTLIALYTLL